MSATYVLLGAVLCLALAAAVAALAYRAHRRRRAVSAPRLPPGKKRAGYPVVLAHGLMGFDELKVPGLRHGYFRGVPERLRTAGSEVHVVRVRSTGSVAERAEELARAVRSIPAERVNIIAHSMGGLDARYAISCLGMASKVASLTTVGTPHLGTPVADAGTGLLGDRLGLRRMAEALRLPVDCFYELTVAHMDQFNREVKNAKDVHYASFVAHVTGKRRLNPLLWPTYLYLADRAGENDGLVPASSQRWGELLGTIHADHWAQIGWSRHFDAPAFYAGLVTSLRTRGL